jgi:GcrA cell cycle regulator
MRTRRPRWTDEEDERLRALVAQGASVIRAAAALKRTILSVRDHARKIGCPFPTLRVARQKRADPARQVRGGTY